MFIPVGGFKGQGVFLAGYIIICHHSLPLVFIFRLSSAMHSPEHTHWFMGNVAHVPIV